MRSANGFIRSTGGAKFTATFNIDGDEYTYSGSFDTTVPMFCCSEVEFFYVSRNQLRGEQDISGKIGARGVSLDTGRGQKIVGPLDDPLEVPVNVAGSGTWSTEAEW